MWMSEAPRLRASMRRTFESLMTGAASDDLASAPRSISSPSVLTVSTSASSPPMASMSTSDNPTEPMSSQLSVGQWGGGGGAGRAQGEDVVLRGGLGRDDLDDRRVHLEVIEVDGGHTVLAREEAGDLLVAHVAQADESLPELAAVHLLMTEGFL